MSTKKVPKGSIFYCCNFCDYESYRKSQYDRHLMTSKHKNQQISTISNLKVPNLFECVCGNTYKERSGLWRHKKKCGLKELENIENKNDVNNNNPITEDVSSNDVTLLVSLVKDLMKTNQDMQSQLFELTKEKGNNINYNNTNTNSHNKFNLNFFLNEQCKEAMNLVDFVKSIEIGLQDLENVGKLGYVEGISNILVNSLKKLDVCKRPIHCSDIKRETIHIKDQDIWELDKEKELFTAAIKQVSFKNVKKIPEWKIENPDWKDYDSKVYEIYEKLLYESMGSSTVEDKKKSYGKIMKNVVKEVTIDK